jgi:hypothetical protein
VGGVEYYLLKLLYMFVGCFHKLQVNILCRITTSQLEEFFVFLLQSLSNYFYWVEGIIYFITLITVLCCACLDQQINMLIELLSIIIHMKINALPVVSWLVHSHDHPATCQILSCLWGT